MDTKTRLSVYESIHGIVGERTSPLPKATAFSLLFSYAGKDHKFVSKLTDIGGKLDRKKKEVYFDFTSAAARTKFRKKHKDIIKSLSESVEELDEAFTSARYGGSVHKPKKTNKGGDPRIAKLSKKSKEMLASLANAMDTTGGPFLDSKNVKFLTRQGVDNTLEAGSKLNLSGGPKKFFALIKKELGESVELDEVRTRPLTNPMKPANIKLGKGRPADGRGARKFQFPSNKQANQFSKDIANSGVGTGDVKGNKVIGVITSGSPTVVKSAIAKYLKKNRGKELNESVELDEASQRFGGDTNIPADKKTKAHIESGKALIHNNVLSSLHPSARFVVIRNPNKGSNQDKFMMFTISDPMKGRIKMFAFHGTHVSIQKAMDFAKLHKLVAKTDRYGRPLYAKESVEMDEAKSDFTITATKNNKVVETMPVSKREIKDVVKFLKQSHKGAKITVKDAKGKVISTESTDHQFQGQYLQSDNKLNSILKTIIDID